MLELDFFFLCVSSSYAPKHVVCLKEALHFPGKVAAGKGLKVLQLLGSVG